MASSSDKESSPTLAKLCRACMDFKSWIAEKRKQKDNKGGSGENDLANFVQFKLPDENDEYGGRGSSKGYQNSKDTSQLDEREPGSWGSAAKYGGCPADKDSLGRSTWVLLHTIGAYYPDKPSKDEVNEMKEFIRIFSNVYPCPPCAEEFREWLKTNPPRLSTRKDLVRWFCDAHNEVNRKQEKPLFNCDLVDQRWLDGFKDGSCD